MKWNLNWDLIAERAGEKGTDWLERYPNLFHWKERKERRRRELLWKRLREIEQMWQERQERQERQEWQELSLF